MKRLYFMAQDVGNARHVVEQLLLARIPEKHIHVIARPDVPLEDLPEASVYEKSDLAPALEKGVAIGGAAGALAGLAALAFPAGVVLGGGAVVLASTVAGASVGAFSASLKAVDVPNSRLREFEEEIRQGEVLVIADVAPDQIDSTRAAIATQHIAVKDKGPEPVKHPFP
ncbi:MAG TPA: hypothetical protein VFN52_03765 [Acidiferrobacteraceae bacterium]|nr:hypothetical protein [Acidiferrobacteraceae bacterium]